MFSAEVVHCDPTRLEGFKDVFLRETTAELREYIHCLQ